MDTDRDIIENITFEELAVGQTARLTRTLCSDDITAFAIVSGDVNPAHLDPDYANHTQFHGVIGHGMWSAALISRLLGNELPGPGTIYLAQTLHFLKPVRIGDELRVTARVTAKDPATRQVLLDCDIKNQSGAVVLTGVATVIAPADKVRRPRARLPQLQLGTPTAPHAALLATAARAPPLPCAVVHPCDPVALRAALDAARLGLLRPVLVGPRLRLQSIAAAAGLALDGLPLKDVPHSHAAADAAVAMAARGEVRMLMQGSLTSGELLAALRAEPALRTERLLSHIFQASVPLYDRPLLITDGVLNLQPGLEQKADIVRNAVALAHALGNAAPRVAILAADGVVRMQMPSTLDAAALCKMAERGQITGALVDGPLAFDQAILPGAARAGAVGSAVAGQADILVAPGLEAGSLLVRQLASLAGAAVCGVVAGARVPVALADGAADGAARVASAALALLLAHGGAPANPQHHSA